MNHSTPDPLPPDWLPEPVGPASGGDQELWDRRLGELMSAAEPALAELAREAALPAVSAPVPGWLALLADRWRPTVGAAALVAASLALVVGVAPRRQAPATSPDVFSLTALAGEGSPAALWQGMGSEADPTLAQIVLEGVSR
jgi:hypothetical protein